MKCNFYRAGDTAIAPAKKRKTRICEDCRIFIPAVGGKKVCSACSSLRYEALKRKIKRVSLAKLNLPDEKAQQE